MFFFFVFVVVFVVVVYSVVAKKTRCYSENNTGEVAECNHFGTKLN
jgi:cell division protein FtsL